MKKPPLQQQCIALERARGSPYFAFFMEQGTGKSYVVLSEAETLFTERKISMLIVIAPNGVQLNWVTREAPKHLSVPFKTLVWSSNHNKKYLRECTAFVSPSGSELAPGPSGYAHALRILAFNVEAFNTKKSKAEIFLRNVLKRHKVLLAIDESSTIKNLTGAARTRHIISIGKEVGVKRILTGTPATQSPFNFYAQAKFLKEGLLCGYTEYTPFKQYFGEWKDSYGRDARKFKQGINATIKFPVLVRYRNLDILKAEVDKFSYTVMKKDCLDLPPKIHEQRIVLMTDLQASLYERALSEFIIWLGDERVTIAHAFTRLTRLRQILGGFLKTDEDEEAKPIPGENPKIESMKEYIDEMPGNKKLVIWSPYVAELNAIADALGRKQCALYWGDIKPEDRHENIDRFQTDEKVRFFVGNPQSGKFGIELFAASHVLYYSNSFSADARWQSEDRVHRIGQSAESVLYTDLVIPNSIDTKILHLLKQHTSLANLFKGDKAAMTEWLRTQDEELDERFENEMRERV